MHDQNTTNTKNITAYMNIYTPFGAMCIAAIDIYLSTHKTNKADKNLPITAHLARPSELEAHLHKVKTGTGMHWL